MLIDIHVCMPEFSEMFIGNILKELYRIKGICHWAENVIDFPDHCLFIVENPGVNSSRTSLFIDFIPSDNQISMT